MRQVGILSNQLSMTLVQTRQKLQPFIDNGFAHEDRKKKTRSNYAEMLRKVVNEKRVDQQSFDSVVHEFRKQIKQHMREREMFELDLLIARLSNLDDSKYNNELYKQLRLDIIHAQICLAGFFEWKQKNKLKQIKNASSLFTDSVKNDERAENVRKMLRSLPERQKSTFVRSGNRSSVFSRRSQMSNTSNTSILGGDFGNDTSMMSDNSRQNNNLKVDKSTSLQ